jgi:DNA helicase-2/ATP-dependent DNA helicase PcrA
MYVACTRAKEFLELYVPASMYDKSGGGRMPTVPSPFVRELAPELYDEWQEGYGPGLVKKENGAQGREKKPSDRAFRLPRKTASGNMHAQAMAFAPEKLREQYPVHPEDEAPFSDRSPAPPVDPSQCGYCRHRIFGRGKIVQHLPPDKYRVNFPGFGLKVIMAAYLDLEEN